MQKLVHGLVIGATIGGWSLMAADRAPNTRVPVIVQVDVGKEIALGTLKDGEAVASALFSIAHIDLAWTNSRPRGCNFRNTACEEGTSLGGFSVRIQPHAPKTLARDALASARRSLESGVQIEVYNDRVSAILRGHFAPERVVLGYVLAHEIGHALQGNPHHSQIGIMRVRWSNNDFRLMTLGALVFSAGEIEEMRRRIDEMRAAASARIETLMCIGGAQEASSETSIH